MLTKKRFLALVDVDTTISTVNGDRTLTVTNGQRIICKKDLVGLQTQQFGQAQGFIFNNSLEIDRTYYNNQKYCYCDSKLYEIKSIGKAKLEKDMLLNVTEIVNAKIIIAITAWLGGA
jgi:hypothetical protein